MASVTPGYTFSGSTDPITSTKLNLLGQPTVAIGAGEVVPSNMSSSGIGLSATGSGGTVTQATSKATGVTLNKACGAITLNNANLAADTTVSFTLTNSLIAAGDLLILNHTATGTFGGYVLNAHGATTGSITIDVHNCTPGALAEAIVISFMLIKATTA